MFKHNEIIRNLLALSRKSNIFTKFQIIHLSATVHEIHADFVMFSKYSKCLLQVQVHHLQGGMLWD